MEGGLSQDFCAPTYEVPWSVHDAPSFQYGPVDSSYAVGADVYILRALEVAGTFAPDGTWIGGGELAFALDARDLVDAIDEVDTWEDFCALTASFGAPCQDCVDGTEACLAVRIDQIEGTYARGTTIERIPPEGDPRCSGPPSCGCGMGGAPRSGGLLGVLGVIGAALGARRRRGRSEIAP